MKFLSTTLLVTLFSTLTLGSVLSVRATKEDPDTPQEPVWKITKLQTGCSSTGSCSYYFQIDGTATDDVLPFSAVCTSRASTGNNKLNDCHFSVVPPSDDSFSIVSVKAYVSQCPTKRCGSKSRLRVELTFNKGDDTVLTYYGQKTGSYKDFTKTKQLTFTPKLLSGVA